MATYTKSFIDGSATINQNINIDNPSSGGMNVLCSLADTGNKQIFEVVEESAGKYTVKLPKDLISGNEEIRKIFGIADADKDKDYISEITNVTYVDAAKTTCGEFEGFAITLKDGSTITSNAKGVKLTSPKGEANIDIGDNSHVLLTPKFFEQALDSVNTSVSLFGKTNAKKAAVDIASNSLINDLSPELSYNYIDSMPDNPGAVQTLPNSVEVVKTTVSGSYPTGTPSDRNVKFVRDKNGVNYIWHENQWTSLDLEKVTIYQKNTNNASIGINRSENNKRLRTNKQDINIPISLGSRSLGGSTRKNRDFLKTFKNFLSTGTPLATVNESPSEPSSSVDTLDATSYSKKKKTYVLGTPEAIVGTSAPAEPHEKEPEDPSKKDPTPSTDAPHAGTKRDGSLFKALGGIGFIAALFLFVGAVMVPGAAAALVPAALGVLCASGALYVGSAIYEGNFSSELSSAITKQKKNKKTRERFAKQVLKRDAKISRFKERLATLSPTSSEYTRLDRKIKRHENFNDYNIQNAGPKFVDTLLKKNEEDFIRTYMEANDGKQPTDEELKKARLDFIAEHQYAIARNYIVNGYTKTSKRSLSKLSIAELAILDNAVQEIGTEFETPTTDADKVLGINLSMSRRHRGFAPDAASRTISNQDVRESTSNLINKLIKLKIKTDAIDKEATELDKKIEEEKQKVRTSGVYSTNLENNLDSQRAAAESEINTEKAPSHGARELTNEELKALVESKKKDAVEYFGRH